MEKLLMQQTISEHQDMILKTFQKANSYSPNFTEYVSQEIACTMLGGCHKNTLRQHRLNGDFSGYRTGKRIMYKRTELLDFIQRGRISK